MLPRRGGHGTGLPASDILISLWINHGLYRTNEECICVEVRDALWAGGKVARDHLWLVAL
jgi:hypothetical protein